MCERGSVDQNTFELSKICILAYEMYLHARQSDNNFSFANGKEIIEKIIKSKGWEIKGSCRPYFSYVCAHTWEHSPKCQMTSIFFKRQMRCIELMINFSWIKRIFWYLWQGKSLSEQLFYAGEKGDVEKCSELIDRGADVNWKAGSELVSIILYNRLPLPLSPEKPDFVTLQLLACY